jgi:hypothetical protein
MHPPASGSQAAILQLLHLDALDFSPPSAVAAYVCNQTQQQFEPDAWPCVMTQVDDKAVQTHFQGGRFINLHFPADIAPERVVFVLKELQPENWINNGSCYSVQV